MSTARFKPQTMRLIGGEEKRVKPAADWKAMATPLINFFLADKEKEKNRGFTSFLDLLAPRTAKYEDMLPPWATSYPPDDYVPLTEETKPDLAEFRRLIDWDFEVSTHLSYSNMTSLAVAPLKNIYFSVWNYMPGDKLIFYNPEYKDLHRIREYRELFGDLRSVVFLLDDSRTEKDFFGEELLQVKPKIMRVDEYEGELDNVYIGWQIHARAHNKTVYRDIMVRLQTRGFRNFFFCVPRPPIGVAKETFLLINRRRLSPTGYVRDLYINYKQAAYANFIIPINDLLMENMEYKPFDIQDLGIAPHSCDILRNSYDVYSVSMPNIATSISGIRGNYDDEYLHSIPCDMIPDPFPVTKPWLDSLLFSKWYCMKVPSMCSSCQIVVSKNFLYYRPTAETLWIQIKHVPIQQTKVFYGFCSNGVYNDDDNNRITNVHLHMYDVYDQGSFISRRKYVYETAASLDCSVLDFLPLSSLWLNDPADYMCIRFNAEFMSTTLAPYHRSPYRYICANYDAFFKYLYVRDSGWILKGDFSNISIDEVVWVKFPSKEVRRVSHAPTRENDIVEKMELMEMVTLTEIRDRLRHIEEVLTKTRDPIDVTDMVSAEAIKNRGELDNKTLEALFHTYPHPMIHNDMDSDQRTAMYVLRAQYARYVHRWHSDAPGPRLDELPTMPMFSKRKKHDYDVDISDDFKPMEDDQQPSSPYYNPTSPSVHDMD